MTRPIAVTRHVLAALLCAALVVASAPQAAAGDGPRIYEPEQVEALAKKLGLSAKQKRAIRKIHDDARKAEVKLHADVEVNSIDLRRELEQDDPKENRVAKLIIAIARLEGEVRKTRVLASLAVRKVLSPDQRKKMESYRGQLHIGLAERRAMELARAEIEVEMDRVEDELAEIASHAKSIDERTRAEVEAHKREIERAARDLKRRARELERQHRKESVRFRERERERARELSKQERMAKIELTAKKPAKIYLDGRLVGTTPVVIKAKAGKHVVKAQWKNYTLERRVVVKPGKDIKLILEPRK